MCVVFDRVTFPTFIEFRTTCKYEANKEWS